MRLRVTAVSDRERHVKRSRTHRRTSHAFKMMILGEVNASDERVEESGMETDLLLLYHFRLGSTRCMKPSLGPELVATAPTAMMSWRDRLDVGKRDELGEAGE